MSTLRLETYVPKAGVNKPKSKIGLAWDRLTKPAEEPPYRPLAENFIRVAKIKPGTKDQPLRVKLRHIDPRSTKYIALSYTWDQSPLSATDLARNSSNDSESTLHGTAAHDKPKTTTLLCGGSNFRVRQNLYDALCQIRDVQCDVPVFADALCINFNDHAERSKYIEIVGQVYSRAASVIVYLGPKPLGADSTMLVMRQLVNAIDWRRIGDSADGTPSAYNFTDPHFFQNIGMDSLTIREWRAIRNFCNLRWFTRYWSFFELALAKNALFLWGEACMDYKFLEDFCMILSLSGWLDELRQIGNENLLSSTFHADENVPLIKMLMPVSQLRECPPWSPKSKDFVAWMSEKHGLRSERAQAWQFFEILLQLAEPFECLNPLDRMYAPLTLARAYYAGNKGTDNIWPRPDYQKTVGHVYGEFSGQIAQETGQQSIIAGMEGYTGPTQPIRPRVEPDNRNEHRDSSRNPGPSRGRDQERSRPAETNNGRPAFPAQVVDTNRGSYQDRNRPEERNSAKPISTAQVTDMSRNRSGNNSRAGSALGYTEGPSVSDSDPRFRNVNGTRFKNTFDQNRASTPDREVQSKESTPKTRNGKLVSKRAPSRNG